MNPSLPPQRPILLVEDNEADCEVVRRGLRKLGVLNRVVCCPGADEAVDLLYGRVESGHRGEERQKDHTLPAVILLDLRLTGEVDGRELLARVKEDDHLKKIPIVIWSASSNPVDINYCYGRGASGYIRKTANITATEQALERFARFWLETVTLPPLPA